MSLYSSIRMAANTLSANEIALHVVGQNIANANTPGYIREEVVLTPAPSARRGRLLLGLGVEVEAIVQKIDKFLEGRLRGSVSDRGDAETRESAYLQLEGMIGELSDTDLSTSLTRFFASIAEVLNQPESLSIRNLAVLQGTTLAIDINRLAQHASEIRSDFNDQIMDMAGAINRLIEEIRSLNVRIANTETGDSNSDAVGLRDRRLQALEELAEKIEIHVTEQISGGVAVYTGGDFLVFEGISREVEVVLDSDAGESMVNIFITGSNTLLDPPSGKLAGLIAARDEIMDGFIEQLDDFAGTLAFEFNKLHTSGQGLNGYEELTSEFVVDDIQLALDNAGLEFTPANGSFQVLVRHTKTGQTQTSDVFVDLNGLDHDTTLEDLKDALDAIDGISAQTTAERKLTITAESADLEFAFRTDTSGVLAALGINTFFSGYSARNLGINKLLKVDPGRFAASSGGIGADTENAVDLAAFLDRPIESQNSASLGVLYDRMTGETTQASSIARSAAEGARVFEETLRGQKLAISGVSLDEEAVKMISYQRAFQASARYIGTLNDLLDVLINM